MTTGGLLVYTLTVTNDSLATATDVKVNDVMPAGTSYYSTVGPGTVSYVGGTLMVSLGTLAPNAVDTIWVDVHVTAPAGSTITNTATVSADQPESNPADAISTVHDARRGAEPAVEVLVHRVGAGGWTCGCLRAKISCPR